MADETNDQKSLDVAEVLQPMGKPMDVVDKVFQSGGVGSITTAIGDTFYGINHRQTPNPISINRDVYGLTFFTKPELNMTTQNLRQERLMNALLSGDVNGIPRAIRCTLDPSIAKLGVTSTWVDRQQAFIPLLTNNLLSMSGWPDVTVPIFESPEGVYKETFAIVDGLTKNYGSYDITANFRNIPGDPITNLFFYWAHYMSLVFTGDLVPYSKFITSRKLDYNTRIYRLVLDATKTYVQKIGACGAAIPLNSPMGAAFNFEADRPLNASNDQISINFRCVGALYQDDRLIKEFNDTAIRWNDTMADNRREANYTKVPMSMLNIFNNRGYPRINPDSYELEWWVDNTEFKQRLGFADFDPNALQVAGLKTGTNYGNNGEVIA